MVIASPSAVIIRGGTKDMPIRFFYPPIKSDCAALVVGPLLVLLTVAFPVSADVSTLSEIELTAKELNRNIDLASNRQVRGLNSFTQLGWRFRYVDAFKRQVAVLSTSEASGSGASASGFVMGLAAIDGLTNGVRTSRNDKLTGLAMGLELISFLGSDSWNETVLKSLRSEYRQFKDPTLHLLEISESDMVNGMEQADAQDRYEQNLSNLFNTAREILERSPLDCVPAYYKGPNLLLGSPVVRGEYIPTYWHSRAYLCARSTENVGFFQTNWQSRFVVVQRVAEGQFISQIKFEDVPANDALISRLGIKSPDMEKNAAAILFAVLSPNIPSTWYAIYSAPNADGAWKVFVSNSGRTIEFDPPPDPDSIPRGKRAQPQG